ncbi:glycosyltransferase family 2 protein [Nocardioides sp. SYSU D00038]|uniref:glycosyltransferase family 2 protein n=1 Tax=Nocardioides sp. SYSU D00038 TaxID=2812554 RepID=UPI0019677D0C|nr:glycosyltransferase family 2 protein [Nocardioides sp. SYSU D00038]
MTARVKLCAIAKNEGPYLADWVFHHLHFGFDAIEVWVNGTEDASMRILRRIAAQHPQVRARNADALLEECLTQRRHFQQRAYNRLAKRAEAEGFTHVAFLDLDEFWTPRDFRSSIKAFLPADPEVKVVSFPWALDVPDRGREPFPTPFTGPVDVQLQENVKSVGRFDNSIATAMTHTFAIDEGRRLLVRDPFPLVDPVAQVDGSRLLRQQLATWWDRLPEAFVYHAINRSEREYLATIIKGYRQSGHDYEFKTNRKGYLPAAGPVVTFRPPRARLLHYRWRRRAFHRSLDVERMVRRSRRLVLRRAEALVQRVETDPEARAFLAPVLEGTGLAQGAEPRP